MQKSVFTISLCFLVMLFLSLFEPQRIYAQTEIPTGDVSGIWTKANSPYHINGKITVPNDSTLAIEPGVEVIFTGHYKFNVKGRLLARGTKSDTILFTINDTTGFHHLTLPDGGWHGIKIFDVAISNDSTIFEYCTFEYGKSNTGSDIINRSGGAIYSTIDKLRVSHCLFRYNKSYDTNTWVGTSGAILIVGNPIIEYSEFCWNESSWGSVMTIAGNTTGAIIRNNLFHHNTGHGTINVCVDAYPTIINNILEYNHSYGEPSTPHGHGILHFSNNTNNNTGNAKIINNTIVNNTNVGEGGGVFVRDGNPTFINNIVYGNEPSQVNFLWASSVGFYNCLIEGGKEGFTGAAFTGVYENCIDADPQFVSSNDFHLQNTSPCIGAGIDSTLISGTMYFCPTTDFEGNLRPNPSGSMPDIGAYENELTNPSTDIPEWINYNTTNSDIPSDSIKCITIDEFGNKWIGTLDGGLAKFDGTNWTIYNTSNSDLPNNNINSIAIDKQGNKWIVTKGFLVKFDNSYWTIYDTTNSGVQNDYFYCLEIDELGNKWIGTLDGGLAKFDDTNWNVYSPGEPYITIAIRSLAVDGSNNIWFKTYDGLTKFDGTIWTHYPAPGSGGDFDRGGGIAIDELGNKWIGIDGELWQFDDTNWTIYTNPFPNTLTIWDIEIDKSNSKWLTVSGFYESNLRKFNGSDWEAIDTIGSSLSTAGALICIAIDKSDNKWIGTTEGGLFVFSEGVVVSVEEKIDNISQIPTNFILYQNYPNPFNPRTKINYSIPTRSNVTIRVYDVLGKEITTLVNEEKPSGNYEVEFDGNKLSSGVYFYQLKAGNYIETKKMILIK